MEASTTQRMIDSLERAWDHVLRLSVMESELPGSPEWRALISAMQTLQDSIKEVQKGRDRALPSADILAVGVFHDFEIRHLQEDPGE